MSDLKKAYIEEFHELHKYYVEHLTSIVEYVLNKLDKSIHREIISEFLYNIDYRILENEFNGPMTDIIIDIMNKHIYSNESVFSNEIFKILDEMDES